MHRDQMFVAGPPPPPPFVRSGPDVPWCNLIVSIPHAGRHYPDCLFDQARVPRATLERLEDRHVDCLAQRAIDAGHVVIRATHARAYIDLNRSEAEWNSAGVDGGIPPAGVSQRTHQGLGLIPQRLHGVGPLWHTRLAHTELISRIEQVHRPYHAAISSAIADARRCFGSAILIDLHSMPRQPGGTPQIVVGDRHGTTASAHLSDRLLAIADGQGLSVARNAPYAGAHSIAVHADPLRGIEAVQIEFDRTLYLDHQGRPDADGTAGMSQLFLLMLSAASDHGAMTWRDVAE